MLALVCDSCTFVVQILLANPHNDYSKSVGILHSDQNDLSTPYCGVGFSDYVPRPTAIDGLCSIKNESGNQITESSK